MRLHPFLGLQINIDIEKQEELRIKAKSKQIFNILLFGAKIPYSEVKQLTMGEAWELYFMYQSYCEDRNEAEQKLMDEAKRNAENQYNQNNYAMR